MEHTLFDCTTFCGLDPSYSTIRKDDEVCLHRVRAIAFKTPHF